MVKKNKNKKINYTFILLLVFLITIIFLLVLKIKEVGNKSIPKATPSPLNILDQQIKNEVIDTPSIGMELRDIQNKYPWLKQLPLKNSSYVLVYDWEKQSIRARLIMNPNPKVDFDVQVESLKNEVRQRLTEIGVNLNQTQVYFTFTP